MHAPFELGSHWGGSGENSHRECRPVRARTSGRGALDGDSAGFEIPCVLDQAREGFCVQTTCPVFTLRIRRFLVARTETYGGGRGRCCSGALQHIRVEKRERWARNAPSWRSFRPGGSLLLCHEMVWATGSKPSLSRRFGRSQVPPLE